jgi:predicted alpha/beta superfamily hydrolase
MKIDRTTEISKVSMENPAVFKKTEEKESIRDTVELQGNTTSNSKDTKLTIFEKCPGETEPEKHQHCPGVPVTGGSYTGTIFKHADFQSTILENKRDILVYLPPGYNENIEKKYPVLYLADGQNKMNRETSFGGVEWGVDEAAERLIQKGKMQDIIIVAISNTPDRMSEYTHVPDPRHGGGKLDNYASFLTEELKPFIDNTYRTTDKPEETGYMGSSLGGLSALYLGWKLPHVFGTIGALSPSIWWAGKDIVSLIANDSQEKGPGKVWIDIGTQESGKDANKNGIDDAVEDARLMGETLLKKGYVFGKELYYHEAPGAAHSEWHWAQRVDKVLMTLFPAENNS